MALSKLLRKVVTQEHWRVARSLMASR